MPQHLLRMQSGTWRVSYLLVLFIQSTRDPGDSINIILPRKPHPKIARQSPCRCRIPTSNPIGEGGTPTYQGFSSVSKSSWPSVPRGVAIPSVILSRDMRSSSAGRSPPESGPLLPWIGWFPSSYFEVPARVRLAVTAIWSLSSTKCDCKRRLCTESRCREFAYWDILPTGRLSGGSGSLTASLFCRARRAE
jgi:hypothetical protein